MLVLNRKQKLHLTLRERHTVENARDKYCQQTISRSGSAMVSRQSSGIPWPDHLKQENYQDANMARELSERQIQSGALKHLAGARLKQLQNRHCSGWPFSPHRMRVDQSCKEVGVSRELMRRAETAGRWMKLSNCAGRVGIYRFCQHIDLQEWLVFVSRLEWFF